MPIEATDVTGGKNFRGSLSSMFGPTSKEEES